MSKKRSMLMVLVVASVSLPFVAIGAFLREHSPRFDDWSREAMAGVDPAHGIGLAFATWWPLITVFWFLSFVLFITALAAMSWIIRHVPWQTLRILFIVAFVSPTAWVALSIVFDVLADFRWGFHVMAIGECLTVVALILGIFHVTTRWRINEAKAA